MRGRHRLDHAITYAVAAVLLIEAATSWVTATGAPARSRNPYDTRRWEKYLDATSPPHDPEVRILLLSNSQAVAPNLPADAIYPALLEERLNQNGRRPRVRVVNWSLSGLHVPEAIVLLARARALRPALVVGVLPSIWFATADYQAGGRPTPLATFEGDVVDTAWWHRDALPAEFRAHYLTPSAAVTAQLARFWPSYGLRDLPLLAVAERHPWVEAFLPERRRSRAPVTLRAEITGASGEPHAPLVRMFSAAAAALGTPRLFAIEPNAWRVAVPPSLRKRLVDAGWDVADLTDAVPAQQFEPDRIHFLVAGHRTMAEALAEQLVALLPEAVG